MNPSEDDSLIDFCLFVCLFVCGAFLVGRFRAVYSAISEIEEPEAVEIPHPDPLTCGFKYNFTKERTQFRNAWHLASDGAGAEVINEIVDGVSVQMSGDGCAKVRWRRSTKKDRSGLWVWVCMRHHMIVGYHMMPKPEGLRDAIFSIARFKKKAPSTVFVDFACGCEESAQNWVPSVFKDTQFFHDAFHAMNHKCGSRFKSKRLKKFQELDTPLSEQVSVYKYSAFVLHVINVLVLVLADKLFFETFERDDDGTKNKSS